MHGEPDARSPSLAAFREIYSDPVDGGWVGEVPSLPGCISQGDTKEAVLENIRDAIETWIDGAQSVGMPVPEEKFDVQVCVV